MKKDSLNLLTNVGLNNRVSSIIVTLSESATAETPLFVPKKKPKPRKHVETNTLHIAAEMSFQFILHFYHFIWKEKHEMYPSVYLLYRDENSTFKCLSLHVKFC